jgi:hypothetical protein
MAEFILRYPLEITRMQKIKLPRGAKILNIEVIDDQPEKPEITPNIYLIVQAEQDIQHYSRINKDTENRIFLTYGVGSVIEKTGKLLTYVGCYSLTFRMSKTKSFYVYEQNA